MPRRCFVLAATLFLIAAILRAESPGARELGLGKEALAHRDFRAAAEHLTAATQALDPGDEKEALADAWLQLGVVDLTGLDRAADALDAFRKSAELAASPSSAWLWASTAAEKLGRGDEAADLKARALAPPSPEPVPEPVQAAAPAPEPVQAKAPEPTPEPVQAAPVHTPPAEPAPAPAPARPKPSAFQHFFGPKERKAPAAPAKPSAPPPAPAPAPPQAKEGDAFQRLFGENRLNRPEGAREAQAEGPEARKGKEQKASRAAAGSRKVDAFQILFGEKKKGGDREDGKAGDQEKDTKPQDGTAPPR